jgi:tetratricopeptide (TPR) repeat protein
MSGWSRLRRSLVAVGLTAGAAVGSTGTANLAHAAEPLTGVADLRYGVALYHYYQNRNLEALSELMVAQKQGGIQGHGDNPEIMEGGFSMAYGMERKASDIFTRLLDANRPQRTRDAAWFYLAQMRYLRNDWPASAEALSHISAEPEESLQPEVTALRFNLAVQQDQLPQAASILAKVDEESRWRPYMQFNLGAAHSRAGRYDQGVKYLVDLLEMPQRSSEHLALYDKAMTAAGYAYLLQDNYNGAIQYFSQVRLSSLMSNRALLGYGWAAVEKEDYREALKPWQALSKRPLIDQYAQEVLVALPYAYEKMGLQAQALGQFRAAETSYLAELQRLQDAMKGVEGYAIREALNIDRSADFDWLEYAEKNQLSPQMTYLIALFSRDEFIGLVQELRDLLAIQNQFALWQNKMDFYLDMLDERETNRAKEVDYLAQQETETRIAEMVQQRNQLATELERLQKEQDFLALVGPDEHEHLERILRSEKNVSILQSAARDQGVVVMPAAELVQLAETLRRQKGLMLWGAAEMFDERVWRAKRELALVDQQLADMRATQERVIGIVDKGYDLQPYRQRIIKANQQLITQSVDIDFAIEQTQDALRQQVIEVLKVQHGRMNHYLAQTRLSIARLLDASASARLQAPVAPVSDTPPIEPSESAESAGGEQ